ncbi:NAD(P)-dependent oxidoreductase [Desulfosediminicola sp.]|uniref:NAD(P)-dependent oxidoreductase n=1 Tax=Desulfosediminicola sp. TaxID=2886825 RepID=UPI003AF269E7
MKTNIIKEAHRCLQCKKPLCRKGCPNGTRINEMISLFLKGDLEKAGRMLFENNPLSVVCSKICPHENFCEGHCILGKKSAPINISGIEHFISTYYLDHLEAESCNVLTKEKVAIIGSGPAGITVAFILATNCYDVTIFESEDKIGGILQHGIPEFRLSRDLLAKLKDALIKMGVKIRPNTLIGPVITIDDLLRDAYSAVFIGTGVWNPRPLRIAGETLGHVHYGINYLKNPEAYSLGRKLAIIGAGNVAMDVARTALRNGVDEVVVLYRKGENNISATRHEYESAVEDGVKFAFFHSPNKITDAGVLCTLTSAEGNTEGQEVLVEADAVAIAISQDPRSNLSGIGKEKNGLVITDGDGRTTREGVFASGDVVTGAKTVAEAVSCSKRSAAAIMEFVESKRTTLKTVVSKQ